LPHYREYIVYIFFYSSPTNIAHHRVFDGNHRIIIWIWYCSWGGGSMPELAFVIQWPFLCNVFSLHSLFPPPQLIHTHPHTHIHTASLQHTAIIRGPVYVYKYVQCVYVCICPSDGGVRIEFARVRKALSRAFYNCCYYHLIKILRTLFLRLFDTHARTHAHANTYTHILYMSTRARACVCSKTFWVARRGTRGETSTREIVYIYIFISYTI